MGNEWAVGFWGVGFHFQRRVGAFWLAFLVSGRGFSTGKKRKAFWLFQHKGFQHRGGGWFLLWGVPASKKNFSSARTSRGWWCSSGVTVGFARVVGVLLTGLFRRETGKVPTGLLGGFRRRRRAFPMEWLSKGGGGLTEGKQPQWRKKIEPDSSDGTVQFIWFASRTTGLTGPIPVWPFFSPIDPAGPELWPANDRTD